MRSLHKDANSSRNWLQTGNLFHTGPALRTHPGCSRPDTNHTTKPNSRVFPSKVFPYVIHMPKSRPCNFYGFGLPCLPCHCVTALRKMQPTKSQQSLPKYTSSSEASFATCWGNGSLSVSFWGHYRDMPPATRLPAEHSFAD